MLEIGSDNILTFLLKKIDFKFNREFIVKIKITEVCRFYRKERKNSMWNLQIMLILWLQINSDTFEYNLQKINI